MKEVELKQEWIDKYNDSLASHIRYYREAADKLGVDKELISIHDLTKISGTEYQWYVRKFGGGIDDPEFDLAWNNHIHFNPHHWQYWIIPGGYGDKDKVLEMPEKYALEMVADWMGSGKAYTGDWDMSDWLMKNLGRIKLHKNTRRFVARILIDKLGYNSHDVDIWFMR